MDKEEKQKGLTNLEAIKLVEKYKVLENKYEIKKGFLIHKIFAVPSEYYLKCKNGFGFNEMWNEQYHCLNMTLAEKDYEIVALHKLENENFLETKNIIYLEELYHLYTKKY